MLFVQVDPAFREAGIGPLYAVSGGPIEALAWAYEVAPASTAADLCDVIQVEHWAYPTADKRDPLINGTTFGLNKSGRALNVRPTAHPSGRPARFHAERNQMDWSRHASRRIAHRYKPDIVRDHREDIVLHDARGARFDLRAAATLVATVIRHEAFGGNRVREHWLVKDTYLPVDTALSVRARGTTSLDDLLADGQHDGFAVYFDDAGFERLRAPAYEDPPPPPDPSDTALPRR